MSKSARKENKQKIAKKIALRKAYQPKKSQNGYQILAEMVMDDLQSSGDSIQKHLYNGLVSGETLVMTALGGSAFAFSSQLLSDLIGCEQAEIFFSTFGSCKSISMINFENSDIPFPVGVSCFTAPYDENNQCLL